MNKVFFTMEINRLSQLFGNHIWLSRKVDDLGSNHTIFVSVAVAIRVAGKRP